MWATNSDVVLLILLLIHYVDGLYDVAKHEVHVAVVSLGKGTRLISTPNELMRTGSTYMESSFQLPVTPKLDKYHLVQ